MESWNHRGGILGQDIFVGRQAIVDRHERVVAYELLYRSSSSAQFADFEEIEQAAVRVIVNTFASLGMEAVLGQAQGFFNVTARVFRSELVEAMPRERVLIEVLELVEPTPEIVARCRELSSAGFKIALDDWVVDDPRASLLPFADVVKVDLPSVAPRALRKLVRTLREHDVQLLAEKVETPEQFTSCHKLGFDLFQGYYFARPVVLEGKQLEASKRTLLALLQQITSEAETREIVETLKQDTRLGLNLLRLVNTAGHAVRVRLQTIEDAVRHLGQQQLGRWVAILLYADDGDAPMRSPLLTTAAHRGRLMELLVGAVEESEDRPGQSERAFLVGMLSLADALLGLPLESIVGELRVSEEIARALVHHEGELGQLLCLAEAIERGDLEKFEPELHARDLDLEVLQQIDNDAYAWVHGLNQSPTA